MRPVDAMGARFPELAGAVSSVHHGAVATITMAAFAVRSASLPFVRPTRSLCNQEVSANSSERPRTLASFCHAEGHGFESHHPLLKPP
jgi:hypothetical protein